MEDDEFGELFKRYWMDEADKMGMDEESIKRILQQYVNRKFRDPPIVECVNSYELNDSYIFKLRFKANHKNDGNAELLKVDASKYSSITEAIEAAKDKFRENYG